MTDTRTERLAGDQVEVGDDDDFELLQQKLASILAVQELDFRELAMAAGMDPCRDFVGKVFEDIDFGESDLSGFNFSAATFKNCNLENAKTENANFLGARGVISRPKNGLEYFPEDPKNISTAWSLNLANELETLSLFSPKEFLGPEYADLDISKISRYDDFAQNSIFKRRGDVLAYLSRNPESLTVTFFEFDFSRKDWLRHRYIPAFSFKTAVERTISDFSFYIEELSNDVVAFIIFSDGEGLLCFNELSTPLIDTEGHLFQKVDFDEKHEDFFVICTDGAVFRYGLQNCKSNLGSTNFLEVRYREDAGATFIKLFNNFEYQIRQLIDGRVIFGKNDTDLWNQNIGRLELFGHNSTLVDTTVSLDLGVIVTLCSDGFVRIFDAKTGNLLRLSNDNKKGFSRVIVDGKRGEVVVQLGCTQFEKWIVKKKRSVQRIVIWTVNPEIRPPEDVEVRKIFRHYREFFSHNLLDLDIWSENSLRVKLAENHERAIFVADAIAIRVFSIKLSPIAMDQLELAQSFNKRIIPYVADESELAEAERVNGHLLKGVPITTRGKLPDHCWKIARGGEYP